ncbi:heavy metal translocating P-type ATPase [Campylobacter geochelonis]|uniref:heavy metal translocating P-type ATPase n=1 Tax=Campylobacter geochelonis TaxID=1780362 RepID=UPI000770B79A|nr:heavy metal translocating P-type ATPase [Campylobacter geochelonis]CZE50029.1 copper-translocating P-type ATPase [Campylobacter geochelonis]
MSQKIKFNIVGMTCVNCSNAIERVTKKIDGVNDANVSFTSSLGEFDVENESVINSIKAKIQKLGYEIATDYEELESKKQKALKAFRNKLILAAILTAVIMYFHMFYHHGKLSSSIQFILTFVVVFYCGKSFFIHGYGALRNKNFDMNVLVSLGTLTAFLYSSFIFFFPNLVDAKFAYVYFESAAMIVTFILFGKFLEENSKLKANDYIKSLLNLTPKMALLLKKDGTSEEILADKLQIGDIVMVKSGMTLPCDGVVVGGGAEVDTSVLTGESLPIYKKIGDMVNAGCVNTNGYLNVKVITSKHETLLARITKLLSEAGAKKMPISKLADRVANIFVPSVIVIAVLTFVIWAICGNPYYGMMTAIAVLVISCPCALGLATPIAIVCALSNSAKNGMLVKNPEVMEILKDVKTVVFDKTGTLTKGEISVYKTNLDKENLLKIANAELLSEHLISKAVVKFAIDSGLSLSKSSDKFENIVGKGIKVADGKILVGSEKLLNENAIFLTQNQKSEFEEFLANGFGVILAVIDGEYVGYIALSDSVRDSSKSLINELREKGVTSVMLTGDNEKVAKFIASSLGIDKVHFNVLPQEKLSIIQEYQKGSKVIFVGDGVNDALSLKGADCGIAMNSGSDIAKGAGDILLVNNNLNSVSKLINLSEKTMNVIKQNLFWAFFYNIICIPIAAGVLYPSFGVLLNPAYAALAMSFSSVTVVLNSLRLKFGRI